MSPFSFLFSNINVSQRIESFREAEASLLEFAKTRFPPGGKTFAEKAHHHHDTSNHEFEIIDTIIDPPAVACHGKGSSSGGGLVGEGGCMGRSSSSSATSSRSVAPCQLFGNEGNKEDSDSASNNKYRMHGIKVVNRKLSFLDETTSASANTNGNSNATTQTSNQQSHKSNHPAPLVLLHGYANGSLYFYRNFMQLSHYHFPTIYALDMLGWGLSSRPNFEPVLLHDDGSSNTSQTNSSNVDIQGKLSNASSPPQPIIKERSTTNAENFFIESLESWRQSHNLPKLTLAGHSMGGYLSVAYAERYPQHVERLILLSPVGVPEKKVEEDLRRIESMPFYIKMMVKTVRYLFEKGVTPGAFLRSLPLSKSKSMVDSYILNRLPAINCEEERGVLSEYLYQNSMMPGSGESALSAILTSGAFARVPLVNRIPELRGTGSLGSCASCGEADGKEKNEEEGMEIHFIYGENDWMDYKGGLEVQRLCWKKRLEWKQQQEQREQEEKQSEKLRQQSLASSSDDGIDGNRVNSKDVQSSTPPPRVFVHGVRNAGHLLMLDNFEEFNAAVIIAAGGEDNLPEGMSRPVEFVCSEMMAEGNHNGVVRADSNDGKRGVVKREIRNERDAALFFRAGRWNRQDSEEETSDDATINDKTIERMEEKKVEEQLA